MRRRALLAGLAMAAGDGLVRPLNAPGAAQLGYGVQPGVTSGVVIARIVIIYGTGNIGLFEYQGTPGPGNPPIAYIAPPGVTADPYGNSLPVTSGGFVSAESGLLAALTQGEAVLSYEAGTGYAGQPALAQPAGMRVEVPSAASDSPALLIAGPSADSSATTSFPFLVLYGKSEDGTSPPSVYTGSDDGSSIVWTLEDVVLQADTWHTITGQNSWGNFRCTMKPDNTVMLNGQVAAGTLTNGTVIGTLPSSAYYPASQQRIPAFITAVGAGSAATGNDPYIQITTGGSIEIGNVSVQVATNVGFCGAYPLD